MSGRGKNKDSDYSLDPEFIRAKRIAERSKDAKESGDTEKIKQNTEIVEKYLPSLIGATRQLKEKVADLNAERLNKENFLFVYDDTLLGKRNFVLNEIYENLEDIAQETHSYTATPIINARIAEKLREQKVIILESIRKLSAILVQGMQFEKQKTPPKLELLQYLVVVSTKLINTTKVFREFGIDCSSAMLEAEKNKIQKFIEIDGKMKKGDTKSERTLPFASFHAQKNLKYGTMSTDPESPLDEPLLRSEGP